jgi:hypothetical protein
MRSVKIEIGIPFFRYFNRGTDIETPDSLLRQVIPGDVGGPEVRGKYFLEIS